MSAFIVNRHHIDALVTVAIFGPPGIAPSPGTTWRPVARLDTEPPPDAGITWYTEHQHRAELAEAHRLAEMLALENARSVNHRYPNSDTLPGPASRDWTHAYDTPAATLRHGHRPTAVETLKLIDCYEYQTCEHHGWRTSQARRFCDALRKSLISHLPGYDDAPWEWTPPLHRIGITAGQD